MNYCLRQYELFACGEYVNCGVPVGFGMQGTRELGTRRELDGCCGECGGDVAEYNRQRRFITLLILEKGGKQSEEGQAALFCLLTAG